ncbi:50S ribosomal protein L18 [Candidatus Berkelbacteria bacterium]|nr:50S ribosomal protein L18 [Candidatus Berkelbacteria bacterium]
MSTSKLKNSKRDRRVKRIRARIFGTAERPRLAVRKTNSNMFAQLIDDRRGVTLVAASTLGLSKGTKTEQAHEVGEMIGKLAAAKKITNAVFDRRGSAYHGRIKALADAARKTGLLF